MSQNELMQISDLKRRVTNLEKFSIGHVALISDGLPQQDSEAVRKMIDDYWEAEGALDGGRTDRFAPPFINWRES